MTDELVARRYPASEFPEITEVVLSPPGAAATLINLSSTGILVGCATRSLPGTQLTVHFKGTFSPATVSSRVVRCEVAGIAPDGSLQFHLGLAFNTRIALARDAGVTADEPDAADVDRTFAAAAVASTAPQRPVSLLRNRW